MSAATTITSAGLRRGLLAVAPLLPAILVFAMAFGAIAAKAGLSLAEATLMSAIVYAGSSQVAAMAVWTPDWTFSAVATAVALVMVVNARIILIGASLRPWLHPLPWWQSQAVLATNTDLSFILAMRSEAEDGVVDPGILLGAAIGSWLVWTVGTVPGWWLGLALGDVRRYALDLFVVFFFAAMLVPFWKGVRPARPWAVAAAVAVACAWLVPGQAYILAGSIAGLAAGYLLDD